MVLLCLSLSLSLSLSRARARNATLPDGSSVPVFRVQRWVKRQRVFELHALERHPKLGYTPGIVWFTTLGSNMHFALAVHDIECRLDVRLYEALVALNVQRLVLDAYMV